MKYNRVILLMIGLINVVFINHALCQTELGWVKQFGGANYDYGKNILYFPDGYLYISGNFQDSLDVDPGPGITMLYSNNGPSSYISKFDTSGNFIWAKQLISEINAIAFDKANNILAVGTFRDSIDFDPGSSTYFLCPERETAGFLWVLDSNGNFVNALEFDGQGYCQPVDLEIDNNKNILITGTFSESIDFNPNSGIFLLNTPEYTSNAFICKLDSSEQFVWAKQIKNNSMNATDYGNSTATDNQNNIYLAGNFHGLADFDPGPENYYLQGDYHGDGFICKLNSDGNFIFAKKFGSNESSSFANQVIFQNDSTLLISGQFIGLCYFDSTNTVYLESPQAYSIYLCKMSRSGELIWVKPLLAAPGSIMFNETLNQDIQGNIYLAGSFSSPVDFDFGPEEYTVTPNGSMNDYICKYNSELDLQWVNTIDVESSFVISCSSDNFGNLYCTGSFDYTVDFDPGAGTYNLTSNGAWDGFILKLHDLITNIPNRFSSKLIEVNPNPAINSFNINFQAISSKTTFQIFDLSGKKMTEMKITPNQTLLNINCSSWPAGIYYGQLNSDGETIALCKVVVK